MLVVVAISAMLATIAISYGGIERDQTGLSVEKTKMAEFILQARSLALATYKNSNTLVNTCGYGVLINNPPNTYSIFAYTPVAAGYHAHQKEMPDTPHSATRAYKNQVLTKPGRFNHRTALR